MDLQASACVVVGLGKSGVAAVRLLLARGAQRRSATIARSEAELGADVARAARAGRDARARRPRRGAVPPRRSDRGLARRADAARAARPRERAGVPIASEIELASWFIARHR